jgi:hypothetical protein
MASDVQRGRDINEQDRAGSRYAILPDPQIVQYQSPSSEEAEMRAAGVGKNFQAVVLPGVETFHLAHDRFAL